MARRRRNRDFDNVEVIAKLVFALLFLAALSIGGTTGFAKVFSSLVGGLLWLAIFAVVTALAALIGYKLFRMWRARHLKYSSVSNAGSATRWTPELIATALEEIDWFQFEKFCAALLRAEGFTVERRGGAQPDGGVDLVATKETERVLVQCKHWRSWVVQERVIRELLGSMTHFGVTRGAIYTLKGWTRPAAGFAARHGMTLVDASELARRAINRIDPAELDALLDGREHHCPKCESLLVERSGAFGTFWGCSTFPRCRGKLKYSGAR